MKRAGLWAYFVLCVLAVAWCAACCIVSINGGNVGMSAVYSLLTGLNLMWLTWALDKLRHPDGGAV